MKSICQMGLLLLPALTIGFQPTQIWFWRICSVGSSKMLPIFLYDCVFFSNSLSKMCIRVRFYIISSFHKKFFVILINFKIIWFLSFLKNDLINPIFGQWQNHNKLFPVKKFWRKLRILQSVTKWATFHDKNQHQQYTFEVWHNFGMDSYIMTFLCSCHWWKTEIKKLNTNLTFFGWKSFRRIYTDQR